MRLLCFAHHPESAAFFPGAIRERVGPRGLQLFRVDGEHAILVTGEGVQSAMATTAAALASLAQDCLVLNFGVVGGLDDSLSAGQCLCIRTVYGEGFPGPLQYHSHSSADSDARHDCLSAHQRVLNSERRSALSAFADVVDRELWGIAAACHLLQQPWQSVKIISDMADDFVSCAQIREQAESYSAKLWQQFQNRILTPSATATKTLTTQPAASLLPGNDLHLTQSQRDLLQKLTAMTAKRDERAPKDILDTAYAHAVASCGDDWHRHRPKDRSRLVLAALQRLAYPSRAALGDALERQLRPLQHAGFRVSLSPDREHPELTLQGPLVSPDDVLRWRSILDARAIAQLQALLAGDETAELSDVR